MTDQDSIARHRERWSRHSAVLVATLALTSACATGAGSALGEPPNRPVADAAAAELDPGGFDTSGFDSATWNDAEFNRRFRHEFADVDGVRMHYVSGGADPPLVLLHGWPQSWYAWRDIMPALTDNHTVSALDLPGLGTAREHPPATTRPPWPGTSTACSPTGSACWRSTSSGTTSAPGPGSPTPRSSPAQSYVAIAERVADLPERSR